MNDGGSHSWQSNRWMERQGNWTNHTKISPTTATLLFSGEKTHQISTHVRIGPFFSVFQNFPHVWSVLQFCPFFDFSPSSKFHPFPNEFFNNFSRFCFLLDFVWDKIFLFFLLAQLNCSNPHRSRICIRIRISSWIEADNPKWPHEHSTIIAHHSNTKHTYHRLWVAVTEMILALERNKNSQGSNRAGSNQTHRPITHHPRRRAPATMRWIRINRARTWNWVHRFKLWNSNLPTLGLVGLRFVRPAEPKRFLFANRIPSFCTPNGTGIQNESSWLHKLEDGIKVEWIAWTSQLMKVGRLVQVEKEISNSHAHHTSQIQSKQKIRGSMRPPASPSESSDHPPTILDLDFKQVETNSHRSNRTGFRLRK